MGFTIEEDFTIIKKKKGGGIKTNNYTTQTIV